jgi:hypothetical protein
MTDPPELDDTTRRRITQFRRRGRRRFTAQRRCHTIGSGDVSAVRFGLVLSLGLALSFASGCSSPATLSCPAGTVAVSDPNRRLAYCAPVCDDASCACPVGRVSVWNVTANAAACAPACGDGGACPSGLACNTCLASGDCPTCAVCVAACVSPP